MSDLPNRRAFLRRFSGALAVLGAPSVMLDGLPRPLEPQPSPLRDDFIDLDALGMAELVKRGEISAAEILETVIRRIEAVNPLVNCIATPTYARARDNADRIPADTRFAGVPILIKDMIDVGGVRRSDGSRLLATNVPGESVAYIRALEASGLNIVGTTTVPEFATGYESELYGRTRNPWDLDYTCLLSSSGAGAAVGSGMLPLVHGTDGGGSNRLPSHACGTFGYKPSRLRMLSGEADGQHDLFKTNGPISRTVRDAAALFDVTEDKVSGVYEPVGMVEGPSRRRLRIAFAPNGVRGLPAPVPSIREVQEEIAELLEDLGHEVRVIEHPVNGPEFLENYNFAFLPKFLPLLGRVEQISGRPAIESGLLTPWVVSMIETGRDFTPEQIAAGRAYFDRVGELYRSVFETADVLFSPVLPVETPRLGDITPQDRWADKGAELEHIISMTAPVNAVGDCAMSVPLSTSRETGMPVGSMFHAPAGADRVLFELAYELEAALPWKDRWARYSAKNLSL